MSEGAARRSPSSCTLAATSSNVSSAPTVTVTEGPPGVGASSWRAAAAAAVVAAEGGVGVAGAGIANLGAAGTASTRTEALPSNSTIQRKPEASTAAIRGGALVTGWRGAFVSWAERVGQLSGAAVGLTKQQRRQLRALRRRPHAQAPAHDARTHARAHA
jgi:hypothetical protein